MDDVPTIKHAAVDKEGLDDRRMAAPMHISIRKEPAVLPKKKQEIHRVQAMDKEKSK